MAVTLWIALGRALGATLRHVYALAGAHALGSVVLSLVAIFAGMAFARTFA